MAVVGGRKGAFTASFLPNWRVRHVGEAGSCFQQGSTRKVWALGRRMASP